MNEFIKIGHRIVRLDSIIYARKATSGNAVFLTLNVQVKDEDNDDELVFVEEESDALWQFLVGESKWLT